jgi:hypothetical protein
MSYAIERIEICKRCDSYQPTLSICTECGCWMVVKVHLKDASCPLLKWKEQNEQ